MTGSVPLRRCTACGEEKPATAEYFYPNSRMKDGLLRQCRPCVLDRQRATRQADPARFRAQKVARYHRDHDAEKMKRRTEYARTKVAVLARQADYRKKHCDAIIERRKAARAADPERVRELDRQSRERRKEAGTPDATWRQINPAAARAYHRAYYPRWLNSSPKRRLVHSIAVRMARAIREGADQRSWEALVGYTRSDLTRHLERQFSEDMSWANYGAWHIDHVLPIRLFGFETADDPEFLACYALTNLQPLWAGKNSEKGQRRLTLL